MSSEDNLYSVDQDFSSGQNPQYGPTSGRVGVAPASAQAGRVALGYDANTLLNPLRLDASGNLRTAPSNPSGASVYLYSGQIPPAAASQYGQQIMAIQKQPTPVYLPLQLDQVGALQVHQLSKATARFILPTTVGGASKSMLSMLNGSTSTVIRVQQVNIGTPYVYSTGQSILGLSGTYNKSVQMLHEMRRITGQTKGTSTTVISPTMSDSSDTLDSNIVCMSNATISGAATTPFHRQDANSPSGLYWYYRTDPNSKTFCIRPNEGFSITTITDTSSYSFDIEVVITAAPA